MYLASKDLLKTVPAIIDPSELHILYGLEARVRAEQEKESY